MNQRTRREFLEQSLMAAAVVSVPTLPRRKQEIISKKSDVLRIGVAGVRGRGRAHVNAFKSSPDSEVVAICDPDEAVIGLAMKAVPKAKYYRDLQAMLDDPSIDAVSIATPNHWHSLATIWALQAGKHVYVEKPLSHNIYEGRKVVDAARKYGKLVQHGTQARSTVACRESIAWLQQGGLGKINVARALCYKRRGSIGRVDGPQSVPSSIDYDHWTGPAELKPLQRKNLHYDWHWVFNTGNGDIGNQAVHQIDLARWGLGATLPHRVTSCGGRFGYEDDANTPNTQVAVCDYGSQRVVVEVRGLKTDSYKTANIGTIFECEGGDLVISSYAKVVALDRDGKVQKTFEGDGNHFQNFLDAVKSGKQEDLHANALEGHLSSALCHLGNISYQLGTLKLLSEPSPFGEDPIGQESYARFREHLVSNGLDPKTTRFHAGPTLSFDPGKEIFHGEQDSPANRMLSRNYRKPYVVSDSV